MGSIDEHALSYGNSSRMTTGRRMRYPCPSWQDGRKGYRGVLLDADGTLLDFREAERRALGETLAEILGRGRGTTSAVRPPRIRASQRAAVTLRRPTGASTSGCGASWSRD